MKFAFVVDVVEVVVIRVFHVTLSQQESRRDYPHMMRLLIFSWRGIAKVKCQLCLDTWASHACQERLTI